MDMNKKTIKTLILVISIIGIFLIATQTVSAAETTEEINFCEDFKPTFKAVGIILFILKILVPLGIAGIGMVDFTNSIMKGADSQIKKDAIVLGKRVIIGLIIFFSPGIINTIIDLADPGKNSDYELCNKCVFTPFDC